MTAKKRKRSRLGSSLIFIGVLCLAAAAGFTACSLWDAKRAKKAGKD